ncbi:MAG: hypothetical protein IPJ78_02435 [Gemmatimonadetes bacterium]|nr:hypothetical protein [Gemmatimonadota bacterium]
MHLSDSRKLAGITVGALVELLRAFDPDCELTMGGLQFYRLKLRGEKLLQLEFAQQVYRDSKGKLIAEDVA